MIKQCGVENCCVCIYLEGQVEMGQYMADYNRHNAMDKEMVFEALDNAHDNNFPIVIWAESEIAEDLQRYCAAVESIPAIQLVHYVKEWKKLRLRKLHLNPDNCREDHSKLKMYGEPCKGCGVVQGSDMK